MSPRLFWPVALCLTALPLSGLVLAQTSPAAPAAPATVNAAGAVSIRNARNGLSVWDDVNRIGRMTKEVRVTQAGEDFIMYADDVTYNENTQQAVATGNIRVETRDSTIRSGKIFADFNKKLLTFTENVTMSTYGEKDGIQTSRRNRTKKKPSRLTCTQVQWDYENRQATITGNIRLVQDRSSGTCDVIYYDERLNVARLEDNVRFKDEKGRIITTSELTIFMDTNKIQTPKAAQVYIPRSETAPATVRTTRPPAIKFGPEESISDDQLKAFAITPPPAPTPRVENETEPGMTAPE